VLRSDVSSRTASSRKEGSPKDAASGPQPWKTSGREGAKRHIGSLPAEPDRHALGREVFNQLGKNGGEGRRGGGTPT